VLLKPLLSSFRFYVEVRDFWLSVLSERVEGQGYGKLVREYNDVLNFLERYDFDVVGGVELLHGGHRWKSTLKRIRKLCSSMSHQKDEIRRILRPSL